MSRLKSSSWAGHPAFISACFAAFLSAFFLSKTVSSPFWDFALAVAFSCAMYGMLNVRERTGYHLYQRASHFLSGISYSLYLSHLPVALFLNALIIGNGKRWQPDGYHIFLAVLISVVIVGYACVVWWTAEARTDQVRNYLHSVQRRPLPAQSRDVSGKT